MDLSSLPEAQQQQLQQLQIQFQEHQRQRQQEQEQAAAQQHLQQQQQIQEYAPPQAYDPAHFQSYDQSYYYQYLDPQQQLQYSQQDAQQLQPPPPQQHYPQQSQQDAQQLQQYYDPQQLQQQQYYEPQQTQQDGLQQQQQSQQHYAYEPQQDVHQQQSQQYYEPQQSQQDGQQQQQQQQQQSQQHYSYDPLQSQQDGHQQQGYAYYQADLGNAYQQQPQQQQQQQQHRIESARVHSSGVPYEAHIQNVKPATVPPVQVQVHHQQSSYYPEPVVQVPVPAPAAVNEQNSGYPVPQGLNPAAAAAVAALSQLTEFAGTMDAAERAIIELQGRQWNGRNGCYGPMMGMDQHSNPFMGSGPLPYGPVPTPQLVDQFPYMGNGRRGRGAFRGGHSSQFGNHPPRSGRGGRGRGRGRGGRRHLAPHGASSSAHLEASAAEEAEFTEEEAESSADTSEEEAQAAMPTQTSSQVQGNVISSHRPQRAAWCELCRVDCTSLEILEQHNNGKRHKKNLQKVQGSVSTGNPAVEIKNQQKSVDGPNTEVTLPSAAVSAENDVDNDATGKEQSSNVQERKPSDNQRRGKKRKTQGGPGGKRMRPGEPHKPKVVVPLICDLCNIKCDTQEVLSLHLAGKKHISKLKRFESHQVMYGTMKLQSLYPPNPIVQNLFPQGSQQAGYAPHGVNMPLQFHHSAPGGSTFQ